MGAWIYGGYLAKELIIQTCVQGPWSTKNQAYSRCLLCSVQLCPDEHSVNVLLPVKTLSACGQNSHTQMSQTIFSHNVYLFPNTVMALFEKTDWKTYVASTPMPWHPTHPCGCDSVYEMCLNSTQLSAFQNSFIRWSLVARWGQGQF